MAVLGSTKCWQWQHRPQLGQLCIPKPETGQERPGFPGRVRPVSPGTGQTWVLQASDSCWSCQHYPNPPLPPPLCLPDTEYGQQKAFYPAEFSLFVPSLVFQDVTSSSVTQRIILNLSAPSAVSFIWPLGFTFSHYSSSESPSFPAAHVVYKASLHCAHPWSPLLHISCPSAFPALPLPSPSNNKLKGSPWPALCAVCRLPAAFSLCLHGTCHAGALASAV